MAYLAVFPQSQNSAQIDSTSSVKKDIKILAKKDSILTVKISSQLETISKNAGRKVERITRYKNRTIRGRERVRIDSFYVDTCAAAEIIHDTIYLQQDVLMKNPKKESWLKRTINSIFKKNKSVRKDEMKVVTQ